MRPLLRQGQRVSVEPAPAAELLPGDVILYRVSDRRLLHRLARRRGGRLLVFDDAAVVGWHEIPEASVLGRLRSSGPLSRGRTGLLYGLLVHYLFRAARLLKPSA